MRQPGRQLSQRGKPLTPPQRRFSLLQTEVRSGQPVRGFLCTLHLIAFCLCLFENQERHDCVKRGPQRHQADQFRSNGPEIQKQQEREIKKAGDCGHDNDTSEVEERCRRNYRNQ